LIPVILSGSGDF